MLFNSYAFIFLFLPVTAVCFFCLARFGHRLAASWLTLASLFFYGWWNWAYVPLLLASVACNYAFGLRLARWRAASRPILQQKSLLTLALAANLLLLGYFKYANFFLAGANSLGGTQWSFGSIILPLGISFFTFTQIAYLVDAYQGKATEYSLIHYGLFVTYFPHLIAGPVLHHKEMMPQFAQASTYRANPQDICIGITIFTIGLFKKTVLADGVAPYASPLFAAAAGGEAPAFFEAWGGVLAYTLQLYFDFSGYSDMAIGLSRLFGIRLPLNFHSPYKAVNIIDFWRRWHMTLSRFLRDYLYFALGGNRKGPVRRYLNLMATMLLGGLWHGAGWTFVIWGGLHGLYLVVNHAWHRLRVALGDDLTRSTAWGRWCGRLTTLLAVIVAWVFFRSADWETAIRILGAMAGTNGATVPEGVAQALGPLRHWLATAGIAEAPTSGTQFVLTLIWVGVLLPVALLAPNTQELLSRYQPALDYPGANAGAAERPALLWHPSARWALLVGLLSAMSILSLTNVTEFLYYQF